MKRLFFSSFFIRDGDCATFLDCARPSISNESCVENTRNVPGYLRLDLKLNIYQNAWQATCCISFFINKPKHIELLAFFDIT